MTWPRRVGWPSAAIVAVALVTSACGAASAVTSTVSTSSAPSATAASTATPTPSATAAQLQAVGAAVFPPCNDAICTAHDNRYTTCDGGMTGSTPSSSDQYSLCPFTTRLTSQLKADCVVPSCPDQVGGGQDPEYDSESISADPSVAGGVLHVLLTAGPNTFMTDLVVTATGTGALLVDDIYCTGADPATSDAYAPGWSNRSSCSGYRDTSEVRAIGASIPPGRLVRGDCVRGRFGHNVEFQVTRRRSQVVRHGSAKP